MRFLLVAMLFCPLLRAGVERLPLVVPASEASWSGKSVDEEMAPGIVIDAMYECTADGCKIVAVSSPVRRRTDDRLHVFALGIRDSFAAQGVRDVKDGKGSLAGHDGILMSFVVRQGAADVPAALFVMEAGDRFFAYMSFGGKAGPGTLQVLKKKEG